MGYGNLETVCREAYGDTADLRKDIRYIYTGMTSIYAKLPEGRHNNKNNNNNNNNNNN